jgi:ribosomal protein L20A (L18A)
MRITLFLLCISLCVACKHKNTKQELQIEKPILSEDFEKFYEQFHVDSIFQMNHIVFPLEGRPAMKDSIPVPSDFRWQKNDWVMHKTYDDMGGTFSRSFTNFNNIIIEEISDASGEFTMVRRFSKLNGVWHLIFYKEMGR